MASDVWAESWIDRPTRTSDPNLDAVVARHSQTNNWTEAKALEPEYTSVFASKLPDRILGVTAYSDGSVYVATKTDNSARTVMRALAASGLSCHAVRDPDEGIGVWGKREE